MSEVKRYEVVSFTNRGGDPDTKMMPIDDGEWVRYSDHATTLGVTDMANAGFCAMCGKEGIVEQKKDEKRQFGQELPEVLVTVRFWDCPHCKEAYVDHDQSVETEHQLFHAYTAMFIAFRRELLEMLGEA